MIDDNDDDDDDHVDIRLLECGVYQLQDEDGSVADVEESLLDGYFVGLPRRLAVLLNINQYRLGAEVAVFDLHRSLLQRKQFPSSCRT